MSKIKTSIVVPIYNEADNIKPFTNEIYHKTISDIRTKTLFGPFELIFVDDGSNDNTTEVLVEVCEKHNFASVIRLRTNQGKSAALAAGFRAARGELIVTMDGDRQDNPYDLHRMLETSDKADLVCAWRANRFRNDPFHKTIPSKFYNFVVRASTGIQLQDFNCGYKVYRREVIEAIKLYGELHRFIPVLAHQQGFSIEEVSVDHRPRTAGKSKFGSGRLLRGMLDFVTVIYLTKFLKQPFYAFGSIGLLALSAGLVINAYLSWLWLTGEPIGTRPLLMLGVLMMMSGVQMASIGLIGEMLRYFHYNSEENGGYEVSIVRRGYESRINPKEVFGADQAVSAMQGLRSNGIL